MERIEIAFNRWRLALYIITSLLLLSSFVYITYDIAIDIDEYVDVVILVGCAAGLVVSVYGLLLYSHKAFFTKHGLIITHDGIVNNAGYNYWGFIEWSDIYSLSSSKSGSNYLIRLGIKNHKKYTERMNPARRWLIQNDVCFYGMLPQPLINASLLKCTPEDLETILKDFLEKYGTSVAD